MYGNVLGCTTATAGCLILPNTGGNGALRVVAFTSLTVGVIILLSSVVRTIAKRAYKA